VSLLLATSSVAALTLAGCGLNLSAVAPASCIIQNGGSANAVINGSNSGSCIVVENSASVTSVANAGDLDTDSAAKGTGITVNDSTVSGSVSNAGTISATKTGIIVTNNAIVSGGIANSGTISGKSGIVVSDNATVSGGIANSGTISVGGAAISVETVSTFSGSINNSGTITAAAQGILVSDNTTVSGGIANSGTISAGGAPISVEAVSTFSGNINNSGTITTTKTGIVVTNNATVSGGIANSGTISAGGAAISVATVSTFSGNISNSGTITGKTGIVIGANVTFAAEPAIVNTGTITGTGGTAINLTNATGALTVEIDGGTVTGNILGSTVAGDTFNFAPGAGNTFAYSNSFTNFGQVNVNSGTVVLTGNDSANAIAVNGGTLASTGTITSSVNVNTGGTLEAGTPGSVGTLSVVGALTFVSGATYLDTIISPNVGDITVSGAATLGGAMVAITPQSAVQLNTPYTILTDDGTAGGALGTSNGNAFSGVLGFDHLTGTLSYTGDTVSVSFAAPSGCNTFNSAGVAPCILYYGTSLSGQVGVSTGQAVSRTGITVLSTSIHGSLVDSGVSLAGGIVIDAASTITAGSGDSRNAVAVTGTTFFGGITNAGTLAAPAGDGIFISGVSTFTGGITNYGTITAGVAGIFVSGSMGDNQGDPFSGEISNAGTISVNGTTSASADYGIFVSNVPSFANGIANSGLISVTNTMAGQATGIYVNNVPTFTGGISNSGTIDATASGSSSSSGGSGSQGAGPIGILVSNVTQFGSSASGGVTNSGSISVSVSGIAAGSATGIKVTGVTTFLGGVSNSGSILAGASIVNAPSGGGAIGIEVSGVAIFIGGISNSGSILANLASGSVGGAVGIEVAGVTTFMGGISNTGTISVTGPGSASGPQPIGILVSNVTQFGSSASGGITNSGAINVSAPGGGSATGIKVIDVAAFMDGINNSGSILANASSGGGAIGIEVARVATFMGGITNSGTISAQTGIVIGDVRSFSGAIANSGTISGSGGTAIDVSAASNAITINQTGGLIAGAIKLSSNADVLNISGGSIAGNVIGPGTNDTVNFNLGAGGLFLYGSQYSFTGVNQLNINSGIVIFNGSDNASTLTTAITNVNGGGTLAGTGTFRSVNVELGGTLEPGTPGAPGTTMTINGNLNFQTGQTGFTGPTYLVNVNPSTASFANVTGTATLNGASVQLILAPGSYSSKTTYDILTASSVIGTFSTATAINTPGFAGTLNYGGDPEAMLSLTAQLGAGASLNTNQQNIANAINNYFNSGGTLPANFFPVFTLSGANLATVLSQGDGEVGTGAERGAFDLTNEFLGLMLDPFVFGRDGYQNSAGAALGFAPDPATLPPDIALALAGVLKAPPQLAFAHSWTAWSSAFGGGATTNGDPTVGSNNVTTSTFGYAAGLDYHYSPNTVLGFSLAGGGTNWNLANALGTGKSDAFLTGIYGVTHWGPTYLSGALAFANNWFTTTRATNGLAASFQGQSYSARLEGGYRFAVPVYHGAVGITPYAAIQAQNFHTPAYSETDFTGSGFGLSYDAMNATDTRSEFGGRFDDLMTLGTLPLVLHAKLAWAHDWVSNPALNASFESLPGTSFTVNGAPIPQNSALTSAGAQLFFTPSWSLLAKFDGEFAPGSQTYAGSGTLRYSW
jgi:hypothetical protein